MENPYSLEEIYQIAGKEDKTACIFLKKGSNSHKVLGDYLIGSFIYTQDEREMLDEALINNTKTQIGNVKVQCLGTKLDKNEINRLSKSGLDINDISDIQYRVNYLVNTFHSESKRKLVNIEIPFTLQENGKDYDWNYQLKKKFVAANIGLTPEDRITYLALKLYFEPNELTSNEKLEIYGNNNQLKNKIEHELLKIKYHRKEVNKEEIERLKVLIGKKNRERIRILDKLLKDMGSSLEKLKRVNSDLAAKLIYNTLFFHERQFNLNSSKPIYLDLEGYLHILLRHIEEYRFNNHYDDKDNFQWEEQDVLYVISNICRSQENDIQMHFEKHPTTRYSKYGPQSIYFEGDYYTFHIESNGRISTFHKNRKKIKKANR